MKGTEKFPLLPLRGMVVFPSMIIHLDAGRPRSIGAIEQAMLAERRILLVAQNNAEIEEPKPEDLYSMGTVAEVRQIFKLPGGAFRVLVEGIERARIRGTGNLKPFQVEYYKRFASAFAAFIMTVIGVSLSSRKRKGGMGFSLGVGLVLSVTYAFFQAVTAGFATNANVPPIIAVWLPNILFTLIAIYLYKRAPR